MLRNDNRNKSLHARRSPNLADLYFALTTIRYPLCAHLRGRDCKTFLLELIKDRTVYDLAEFGVR